MFFKTLLIAAVSLAAADIAAAKPTPYGHLPRAVLYAPSGGRWYADHDFTSEIRAARARLAHLTAGYTTVKKRLENYNILLAVKRVGDGIEVVKVSRNGSNREGFVIDWAKANGVNTNFIVHKPLGYTVLAAKRVIRWRRGYEEVVYTPFTDDIDTPAMRARGIRYLRTVIERAYSDLLNANVRSQSLPGRRVAAIIPVKTALALSIIEHIDPSRLKHESVEKLVDEVLVTVAANQDLAYNYAVSRTGARGLFQFMPETYGRITRKYSRAHLVRDFTAGMNNHVNAAKASLLLFDSDLGQLPREKREWLVGRSTNPHYAAVYLAAAYNGGAPRVAASIRRGGAWTKRLRPETQWYVLKLDKVRKALQL
ncbi:MAG: transglycosylase SLT domain-containing protein [Minisyncoccia bacterium]